MKSKNKRTWEDYIPIIAISTYFLISIINIRFPGIHYDEIFYGNAALGVIDPSTFIEAHFRGIPILLIPYIGALKSYIFFPIFKLFGVSIISIRIPLIIITAFALLVLYKTLKLQFNRKIANIVLILIATDPSFIVHMRMDFGPVGLSFLFRIMSMYFFACYVISKKNMHLIYIVISLILGFFNKMDYIWYITAFLGVIMFNYRNNIFRLLKNKRIIILYFSISIITLAILVSIFVRYNFISAIQLPTYSHLQKVFIEYINLISGTSFYIYLFGDIADRYGKLYVFLLSIFLIFFFILAKKNGVKISRYLYYYGIVLLLILAQIIVTSKAEASWHLFMTYPFTTIIIASAFDYYWSNFKNKPMKYIAYIYFVCIILYNFSLLNQYFIGFSGKIKNITWSNAIYSLIDFAKSKDAFFVSVDWGIHNQLLAFDPVKGKYIDRWLQLINQDEAEKSVLTLIKEKKDKPIYFILHPQDRAVFPEAQLQFINIANKNNFKLTLEREIEDMGNKIFRIYKLD